MYKRQVNDLPLLFFPVMKKDSLVAEEGFWTVSAVTWGDWSRKRSSQRSDEAHVTTPGVPIIELRRTGGPTVCNELSERRTESCEGLIGRPCRSVSGRRQAPDFSP